MKQRRIISILLLVVMIFGMVTSVYAEDITEETDFEKLRNALKKLTTDFKDKNDVDNYLLTYLRRVFPSWESINGFRLDYDKLIKGDGFWVYGNDKDVTAEMGQQYDAKGNPVYLGFTHDAFMIPNIAYNETKMSSPRPIEINEYFRTTKPFARSVRPFKTVYTDPRVVGAMYLGVEGFTSAELEAYGRKIIENWMHNTIVRDVGWATPGKTFAQTPGVNTVDDYIKYVAVTIPPTSRTNGLAHMWFNTSSGPSWRSFLIRKTTPIDFKMVEKSPGVGDYTWDEKTKELTVKFQIDGIETTRESYGGGYTVGAGHPYNHIVVIPNVGGFKLYADIEDINKLIEAVPIENFKEDIRWDNDYTFAYSGTNYKTKGLGNGRVIELKTKQGAGWDKVFNFQYSVTEDKLHNHPLEVTNRQETKTNVRTIKIPFGEILADYRPKETKLLVGINAYGVFPEYTSIDNNFIEVIIPPNDGADLYVKQGNVKYDKTIEKLIVEGRVGYKGLRELDITKGELPVEVVFEWSTEDGKKGKETKLFNPLLNNTEENFKFEADIKMPASGLIAGEYKVRVNPEPVNPKEIDYKNNEFTGVFGDSKFPDFAIYTADGYIPRKRQGTNFDLKFNAMLVNTPDKINTNVVLYKGNTQVASQNVTFTGGDAKVITFNLPESVLNSGNNQFTAVINANRDVTVATPFTAERDLSNNSTYTIVHFSSDTSLPEGCKFEGTGDSDKYKMKNKRVAPYQARDWYSDWRRDSNGNWHDYGYWGPWYEVFNYDCDDEFTTYALVRKSEVEYLPPYSSAKNGIFSDDWHRQLEGQQFSDGKGLSSGKNLSGSYATDQLMSRLGYNPLKQVIQAGAGIQVRSKIRVTGYVEEFDRYIDHEIIKNYINSFKTTAMYVSGKDVAGVSLNVRNNEGQFTQRMEYDASRSSELVEIIRDLPGYMELGVAECAPVLKVYATEFEFEIPVIISTATGKIDVLGTTNKPSVPAQRKWFVYLNEMNGKYGLKIVATINPSLLGASSSTRECVLEHDDFKFGIFGTIFDNINTDIPPGNPGGPPTWDN